MNSLRQFVMWIEVPLEQVTPRTISEYIDVLMSRRLTPKTINCHLQRIRELYHYLTQEHEVTIINPVKRGYSLRMPKPLPKQIAHWKLDVLLSALKSHRDRAMFMVMLRCGLRVAEVAHLSLFDIELRRRRLLIHDAKWGTARVVYISDDALQALGDYLKLRPTSKTKKVLLVDKGPCRGQPLSIRGIQKRMEYYAQKTGFKVSCHHLRHTMATQMLNADAELTAIQDLLGHSWITTTQRYCRLSNGKVMREYFKAMEVVMNRTVTAKREAAELRSQRSLAPTGGPSPQAPALPELVQSP